VKVVARLVVAPFATDSVTRGCHSTQSTSTNKPTTVKKIAMNSKLLLGLIIGLVCACSGSGQTSSHVDWDNSGGSGGGGGYGASGGLGGGPQELCAYPSECDYLDDVCVRGDCVNGVCMPRTAPNGDTCDATGFNGVCHDGACIAHVTCDDGNACTDQYTAPNGTCVSHTVTVFGRTCQFNGSVGACLQGKCHCDTDDDCDDGSPLTDDRCWDLECYSGN
jgi:hypothetical protein